MNFEWCISSWDSRAHQRRSILLDDPIDGGDRFTEAMEGGAID
jgi:hypothetical protein